MADTKCVSNPADLAVDVYVSENIQQSALVDQNNADIQAEEGS